MYKRALAVLALVAMLAFQGLYVMGATPRGGLADAPADATVVDPEPWTDTFDDLSRVYMPLGGLVGVDVSNGQVSLKSGVTEGWIASSIFTCPAGNRFDIVVLDVDMPGDSTMEISILDADAEATEVGYANGTVEGFKDVTGTILNMRGFPMSEHPRIRMQVSLTASGSDRPTMRAWTMYYVGLDEWRDDFVTTSKTNTLRGLNVTDGRVEIDLTPVTGKTTKTASNNPYPPLVFSNYNNNGKFNMFYPNFDVSGYDDVSTIDCDAARDFVFEDLNGDGYLDIAIANYYTGTSYPDSKIYWGDSTGKWGPQGAKTLGVDKCIDVCSGDFNGDGDPDLAFAAYSSNLAATSAIFINQGGSFNTDPDIPLTDHKFTHVASGDLNEDGYDDIVYAQTNEAACYYGGPDGPDTTADIEWSLSGYVYEVVVGDVDMDGYQDVLISTKLSNNKAPVYLGSANGMDTTADVEFSFGTNTPFDVAIGDINADGLNEIVYATAEGSTKKLWVFKGTSTGWSANDLHKITIGHYAYGLLVEDINADGYDDIIAEVAGNMRIFLGGEDYPSVPGITKSGLYFAQGSAVAVGATHSGRKFMGKLVTETITRPVAKQWDVLDLRGTMPEQTSVTITIKDSTGKAISGYKDMTDWNIDLSGLSYEQAIHVEIWIESDLNDTTPVLDSLRVNWQDPDIWREQFYGGAKINRLMGATVAGGHLLPTASTETSPDILFATLRNDEGFCTTPTLYSDAGGMDYTSRQAVPFNVIGAVAMDMTDIDGDGYTDVAFAVHQTSDVTYGAASPIFMGSPVGWRTNPDTTFVTMGASDVLLRDINGDGHVDVVFAQERDANGHFVNSTLHWGDEGGWARTPAVEFATTGATGVAAADLDNDGDLDLAFSCYKSTSTETESMVFTQGPEGFNGAEPTARLKTKGATAVASGDLDGDDNLDLVFTNSFHAGSASLPSYIYWGMGDGTFKEDPTHLPTHGASDVELADLDGDGDLDIVFANHIDNSLRYSIDSYVYINDGSGGFGSQQTFGLPTVGASSVTVTDLDGTGWMDLVFTSMWNGTSYDIPSRVFLGGANGYGTTPDLILPTQGATDVVALNIVRPDTAGYMSQRISPSAPEEVGAFHTLRYTAHVQGEWTGTIALVDAGTWETLARTPVQEGTNEWIVADMFDFRDHTAVRVMMTATGLDGDGDLWLDDLWLNWTPRVHRAPVVAAIDALETSLLRTQATTLSIDVTDEFTSPEALILTVEHRLEGTEEWTSEMLGNPVFKDGAWTIPFRASKDTVLGIYRFRAQARDSDALLSAHFEGEFVIEVLNNEPTAPEVRITPTRPVTTATMRIEMVRGAQDVEANVLTYTYRWFRDGVPVPDITGDTVPFAMTSRGENWTVEVRAFDGDVEGPAAYAWKVIQNAPPMPRDPLPDPTMDEDTQDSEWLDLSQAFEDPDGDAIVWSLAAAPSHVAVTIDHATGRVTLVPEENWNGEEEVTFVASDGELTVTQTVKVIVRPINDLPRFVTVDGQPIDGASEMPYSIAQGELLVIRFVVVDIEGHSLEYYLNTSLVQLDEGAGEMRFQPDNSAVGSLRFYLRINDFVSPSEKVTLKFVIDIENANDPMDEPKIGRPLDGDTYRVNQTISLIATCYDPDLEYGQVLNYTWTSDLEGLLGHGSSLTVALATPGTHTIMMTVTDGEFERSAFVTVVIKVEDGPIIDPDDNDQGGDDGPVSAGSSPASLMIVVLAVVGAIGGAAFVMVKRRATDETEDNDGSEDHALSEEERREVLRALAGAVGEAADSIENGKNGKDDITGTPSDTGTTSQGTAPVEVREDVDGLETSSITVPKTTLSIQAEVTKAAPDEVMALFQEAPRDEARVAIPDAHELRLEALKRKYQDAIAHMPYGIPSAELKGWDWTELACALATGPKRTVDGDKEVTQVGGRWYFSDPEEPTTFLKEHGVKPKPIGKGANNKSDLLAKLEERFILGEISEEAYLKLREKYSK